MLKNLKKAPYFVIGTGIIGGSIITKAGVQIKSMLKIPSVSVRVFVWKED
tara:strand:- start:1006 stop:1155 length:150 start_codon:yes stop_codon:yes gene_type:complete